MCKSFLNFNIITTLMDTIKQLKMYKEIVDHQLNIFFRQRVHDLMEIDPFASYMLRLLRDFTMRGGKRIRPALMYYSYRLFSNENLDEIIKASAAFELIQSYLLIHDDIIDKDSLRRGGLTMHEMYKHAHIKNFEKEHMNHGMLNIKEYSAHFGTSMAILTGDAANHLANLIMLNLKIPDERKINAVSELNRLVHRVIYGEALDVLAETKKKVTESDILKIHHLKTASYTFEGPLLVGAILAGATSAQLKILSDYAVPLGQAFQLHDDILGVFGDEKKLGKPVGSDLREGKQTLLVIKALQGSDAREKKIIRDAMGNPDITQEQIEDVQAVMITTGALDHSRKLAKKLINKAKISLEKLKISNESKDFLMGIADYMLERKY